MSHKIKTSSVKIDPIDVPNLSTDHYEPKIDSMASEPEHIELPSQPFFDPFTMMPNCIVLQSGTSKTTSTKTDNQSHNLEELKKTNLLLEDIRVSLDCLTEAVLKVNRTLDKHLSNKAGIKVPTS